MFFFKQMSKQHFLNGYTIRNYLHYIHTGKIK